MYARELLIALQVYEIVDDNTVRAIALCPNEEFVDDFVELVKELPLGIDAIDSGKSVSDYEKEYFQEMSKRKNASDEAFNEFFAKRIENMRLYQVDQFNTKLTLGRLAQRAKQRGLAPRPYPPTSVRKKIENMPGYSLSIHSKPNQKSKENMWAEVWANSTITEE